MDSELKVRLEQEIADSGFPLELKVVEELRAQERTVVRQNVRYSDDGGDHEIDAVASFLNPGEVDESQTDVPIVDLVVECKRSRSKPWVFFQEPYDPLQDVGLVPSIESATDVPYEEGHSFRSGIQAGPLVQHHYNSDLPSARSYFVGFVDSKRRSLPSPIYLAVQSVQRAVGALKAWFETRYPTDLRLKTTRIYQGVIVFDGILAVAEKTAGEGGFEVREENHLLLRTESVKADRWTLSPRTRETIIDIVRADYFKPYLELVQREWFLLEGHIQNQRQAGFIRTSVPTPESDV